MTGKQHSTEHNRHLHRFTEERRAMVNCESWWNSESILHRNTCAVSMSFPVPF